MKIALIITNHDSKSRKNGRKYLYNLIKSIEQSIDNKYQIVVYIIDNQSDKKLELSLLKNNKNISYSYHYIDDQSIGGLTYAWNYGIKTAIENNSDLIINLNDDLIIDRSINIFIQTIIENPNKDISIFGPTTNKGGAPDHQVFDKKQKGITETTGLTFGDEERQRIFKGYPLNGFVMGFTKEMFFKFNIDGWLFSRDIRDAWGCQEDEFYFRNKPKGLKSYIVRECFIEHFKERSWFNARKKFNHPRRKRPDYESPLEKAKCY